MKLAFLPALLAAMALPPAHAEPPASPQPAPSAAASDVPQIVAPSNQDKQWQPTAEQRARVLLDVVAYLAAKDAGRFTDAYVQFTPQQKAAVPFDEYQNEMRTRYAQAGQAQGRTLKMVTWYKNPANAPPGVYAAVDFYSRFSELSLHCGFVAMKQQMDGSFGVAREEENSIAKRDMSKLTPEMLQKIRAEYRC